MKMTTLEKKIARHRNFWSRGPTDRPLIVYHAGDWGCFSPDFMKGRPHMHNRVITPESIDVAAYDEVYDYIDALNASFECDAIPCAEAYQAMPWLEAICGCKIMSSDKYVWAEPAISEDEPVETLADRPENRAWIEKYFESIEYLKRRYKDREDYFVSQTILRGSVDVMSALLGGSRVVFEFYDSPGAMKAVFRRNNDICNRFFRRQFDHVTFKDGGNVLGQFYLWAPGPCLRLQEDATAILNPELFGEFAKTGLEQSSALSPYNLVHLHLTALHVLDDVLSIPTVRAVEICIDEGFGNQDPRMYMDAYKKIQRAGKSLVVHGYMTADDAVFLHENLSPQGLCLNAVVEGPKEAREINRAVGYSL
jgi:hypothetical protein